MIMILQTIGRAMRGDCPAFIYFVDAAWAPLSAIGQTDTPRTSMLLMMRDILRKCLEHEQPAIRACYENLYRTFFTPLSQVQGVHEEGAGRERCPHPCDPERVHDAAFLLRSYGTGSNPALTS